MLNIYPYKSRRRFETTGRSGGINVDQTWTVKTQAIGKSQWAESPYLLANEWICANIAQFLRLPVPPFAIVQKKNRRTAMFTSYSYDGDIKPDDVIPQKLYDNFPAACAGIVVFDMLVANCDRGKQNLQVDVPANPHAFYLIDHERALFYIYAKEGIKRLESRDDRLGVTDGDSSRNEWHCLVELIDDAQLFIPWLDKVHDMPAWFIDDICDEVGDIALTRPECEAVKSFLKERRHKLDHLITTHKTRFPLINNWPPIF